MKRNERIHMEKTSDDVEMGIETQFEEVGMEVFKECEVTQMGAGLDGEEYGEAVNMSRSAVELTVLL